MRKPPSNHGGSRPVAGPALARFAQETQARPEVIQRVRQRLEAEEGDAHFAELLRALPAPAPGATLRVRARLARPRQARLFPAVAFVGVALAALVLLSLRLVPWAPPLSAALDAPEAWEALAATEEVQLDFQGTGELAGTARAPRLEWESGTLRVEVEPERGVDLTVHTREADVRVVGTGFTVNRDALGTTVVVAHGHVAVLCVDGHKDLLGAGESRVCAPTQPAGLLGRARALGEQGEGPELILAAATAGLAAGATGAVESELQLVRVEALTALGRWSEALDVAEANLEGSVRPAELRHLAARNALAGQGCARALPHLRVLVEQDASGPELVRYADCVAATEPDAARKALTAALRLGAPAAQEEGIIERLTRLNRGESAEAGEAP